MSAIAIAVAMNHLRADDDAQDMVQIYLDAAEHAASQFMNRLFFPDQAALTDAQDDAVFALAAARTARVAALAAADALEDCGERAVQVELIEATFAEAAGKCAMAIRGIVLNPSITAACLLKLGHLYEHHEDVVLSQAPMAMPMGSQHLLQPFRIGLGV